MTLPKKSDGWGAIADYIISKENDGSWSATGEASESLSFTRWGLEQAKAIGISKFSFWQYRRAGLLYTNLLDTLPTDKQIPLRDLKEVTPEHLNELQKLSRVAPPEFFKELCQRVIIPKDKKDKITRKELRELWASLRPAMEGENARGRTKQKSFGIRINQNNAHAQALLIEGLILVTIKDNLHLIFDKKSHPHMIECREQYRPFPSELVDALVLCKTGQHEFDYEVHGICVAGAYPADALALLADDKPQFPCDKLWLVVTHEQGSEAASYDRYPDYLGIIDACIDVETVAVTDMHILRLPQAVSNHYRHTINLLAAALCKSKP